MNLEWFDSLMIYATFLGAIELSFAATILSSLLLILYRKMKDAIWLNLVIFGGVVYNFVLKVLISRERPGEERLIEAFGVNFEMASYSFPSGHTMRITLLLLSLTFLLFQFFPIQTAGKRWILSIGCSLILLVAFSRVYLNYHYVSDTAAAILLSLIFFYSMTKFRTRMNLSV